MTDQQIQDLNSDLYSVAVSLGSATVSQLSYTYKKMTGHDIPYKKFGFHSVESFISLVPKLFVTCNHSGQKIVYPIETEQSKHIINFVDKQIDNSHRKNYSNRNQHISKDRCNEFRINNGNECHNRITKQKLDEIHSLVQSCVLSRLEGCTLKEICDDYMLLTETELPFVRCGFSDLVSFLQTVPELHISSPDDEKCIVKSTKFINRSFCGEIRNEEHGHRRNNIDNVTSGRSYNEKCVSCKNQGHYCGDKWDDYEAYHSNFEDDEPSDVHPGK